MSTATDLAFGLLGFGAPADVSKKRQRCVRKVHVQKSGRLVRRSASRDGTVVTFVALAPTRELSAREIEKAAHGFLAARQGPDRVVDDGFTAVSSFLIPSGMKLADAADVPIPEGSWMLGLQLTGAMLDAGQLDLRLGIEADEVAA